MTIEKFMEKFGLERFAADDMSQRAKAAVEAHAGLHAEDFAGVCPRCESLATVARKGLDAEPRAEDPA